ncbi:hypothetical protein COT97_00455 [Candidatus Falkowbacteria bacterium CG10_big_fil_rev_8_21_14_0_10_39_11]|uniref:Uncharacterized protein n=1 Tax=Candidatus Falkowbacteria bacterium CG10_big_fil_rev_8_21_14_0_10_39_11 TaxID=1974565 RepID=A0A2H0V8A9_9BACT|nr:MAG: hypothetical protein COT97_00455 [Candidatus Falkowbacteria bacterium CG10_big_fil_rev_8_21_14_0_10_39_11]
MDDLAGALCGLLVVVAIVGAIVQAILNIMKMVLLIVAFGAAAAVVIGLVYLLVVWVINVSRERKLHEAEKKEADRERAVRLQARRLANERAEARYQAASIPVDTNPVALNPTKKTAFRITANEYKRILKQAKDRMIDIKKQAQRLPAAFNDFLLKGEEMVEGSLPNLYRMNGEFADQLDQITPNDRAFLDRNADKKVAEDEIEGLAQKSQQAIRDVPAILQAWLMHMSTFTPGCACADIIDRMRNDDEIAIKVSRLKEIYAGIQM